MREGSAIILQYVAGHIIHSSHPVNKILKPLMHNIPKLLVTLKKSCNNCCKIFKVCLTILRCYALKG